MRCKASIVSCALERTDPNLWAKARVGKFVQGLGLELAAHRFFINVFRLWHSQWIVLNPGR